MNSDCTKKSRKKFELKPLQLSINAECSISPTGQPIRSQKKFKLEPLAIELITPIVLSSQKSSHKKKFELKPLHITEDDFKSKTEKHSLKSKKKLEPQLQQGSIFKPVKYRKSIVNLEKKSKLSHLQRESLMSAVDSKSPLLNISAFERDLVKKGSLSEFKSPKSLPTWKKTVKKPSILNNCQPAKNVTKETSERLTRFNLSTITETNSTRSSARLNYSKIVKNNSPSRVNQSPSRLGRLSSANKKLFESPKNSTRSSTNKLDPFRMSPVDSKESFVKKGDVVSIIKEVIEKEELSFQQYKQAHDDNMEKLRQVLELVENIKTGVENKENIPVTEYQSPRMEDALKMYNSFRADIPFLTTPKLKPIVPCTPRSNLSHALMKQCWLLQNSPGQE